MSLKGGKGKPTDNDLIRKFRDRYGAGYGAAWVALSEDRRFMGAPRHKDSICHVAALRAIGSERSYLREITIAHHVDREGAKMLEDGYKVACEAAQNAVDKIKPM